MARKVKLNNDIATSTFGWLSGIMRSNFKTNCNTKVGWLED